MKINITSFLFGLIVSTAFFLFTGSIFMPKNLKVNSIEIIDDGGNKSGYLIIKNSEGNIVSYLGVGKSDKRILTLKNESGDTRVNISSNQLDSGYFKASDSNGNESIYID